MKPASAETLDGYFEQARSWSEDRTDALQSSRRTAWIIAAVAVGIAALEALALVLLMPLKRVEPYTLMVDRQTGYVQLLKPLEPQLVSSRAALTQSFLVQYVVGRESFDIAALQANYRKIALWSVGQARAGYLSQMPASNPGSPLALYPRSTIVSVRVKSVSTIATDTALVRFDTTRQYAGRPSTIAQPWVAVIRYGYSNAPMSVEDRYVNPLGFQVRSYAVSAEALPPSPVPPASFAPSPRNPAMNGPQAGGVVIPRPRPQPLRQPSGWNHEGGPDLAAPAALWAMAAFAQQEPPDPRVATIDYRPDQVFRIEAAPGYQMTVEFAADERITSVAVGESNVWKAAVNRAGNQLVVKAVQGGVASNMTVVTTERIYHFDLAPAYGQSLYRLRFHYPPPPPSIASVPVGLTHGYRLSGTRSLWPRHIGDDGERTFIEWAKDVSLPAVYAVDGEGRETLVNGMMRDDRLVIDAVSTQLIFRVDNRVARARRRPQPEVLP